MSTMNPSKRKLPAADWSLAGLEHFTLSDYKRLLLRQKWVIIVTTLAVAASTAVAMHFVPNIYRATTVILVDPRKVPDNYVTSTTTTTVVDRMATLREQILSATRLGSVIDELDLYREMKKRTSHDEIIDHMRKDIEISVVSGTNSSRDLAAFSVSYSSLDPAQAARVTNRLASLFIEENIKSREQQVMGTADFIDKELDDSRKDLLAKEKAIAQLKTIHSSELPESQTAHVQALTSLQLELRGQMDELNRAQQQKLYLQSLLSQSTPVVDLDRSAPPDLTNLQSQLSDAQIELDDLRKQYGPAYPDVIKKTEDVENLERNIKELRESSAGQRGKGKAAQKMQNPVVESQISALDQQIHKNLDRQAEIKKEMAFRQGRLASIPVVEQQMSPVTRDFEVARDHYRMLLEKKFGADMASDLESRQKGERFVILDPAQIPAKPDRPNRLIIDLLALAVGFGLGLATAFVREVMDTSVKTEREITEILSTPIMAHIPWLQTVGFRERRLRRNLFLSACSAALAGTYLLMVVLGSR
jgi:polysaccharide biosynthesis transport protein